MANKTTPSKPAKQAPTRDDRLKSALKANLARRKAQARARDKNNKDASGKSEG